MTAAALTGLASEARIARRLGLAAAASGGDPSESLAKLELLLAAGATGFLSFGICGGLDPALAPGTLLLPEAVQSHEGARHAVDARWRGALAQALAASALSVRAGDILGMSGIVDSAAAKARLFGEFGALAIDMESHHLARFAAARGLPFVVLRAVADPAARDLPPAVLAATDGEGRPVLGNVIRSLLRVPRQLPALLAVARDTRLALAALQTAGAALGEALRLPPRWPG